MHLSIENMLLSYPTQSLSDYINALREIVQKIILLGLWRSKFFEHAAFYGGTSLRILYGLNRYSEDLDFSLLQVNSEFSLRKYNAAIETELQSFGFGVTIINKEKKQNSSIESALLQLGAKQQLIAVLAPEHFSSIIPKEQKMTIKMEVDTKPPLNFETEQKVLLSPISFFVHTFQKPDLFATKIHAILCRTWGTRVKGRDWYDMVWYVGQKIPVRLLHLQTRLEQSGHWGPHKTLIIADVKRLLTDKLKTLDIVQAKNDVLPFITEKSEVEVWSMIFFDEVIAEIHGI